MVKVFHKQPIPTHGMVRVFSEEIHGKDYQEIAKSYIKNYEKNVEHVEGLDVSDIEEVKPEYPSQTPEVKPVSKKKK